MFNTMTIKVEMLKLSFYDEDKLLCTVWNKSFCCTTCDHFLCIKSKTFVYRNFHKRWLESVLHV